MPVYVHYWCTLHGTAVVILMMDSTEPTCGAAMDARSIGLYRICRVVMANVAARSSLDPLDWCFAYIYWWIWLGWRANVPGVHIIHFILKLAPPIEGVEHCAQPIRLGCCHVILEEHVYQSYEYLVPRCTLER